MIIKEIYDGGRNHGVWGVVDRKLEIVPIYLYIIYMSIRVYVSFRVRAADVVASVLYVLPYARINNTYTYGFREIGAQDGAFPPP